MPASGFRRCWAEIDLGALRHNVGAIRERIPPGTGIVAVLKANAYGHGLETFARELRHQVEMFAVANVTEALQLREAVPDSPVMILGPALPEEREAILRHDFLPVVSSLEEARAYGVLARERPSAQGLRVHLAVDTGMGRIGVWQRDAIAVAKAIAEIPGLRLTGMGTHLPVADEDSEWTAAQLADWRALAVELRAELRGAGLKLSAVHALNSAGIIRFGTEGGDLVRAGLMLYGSSPVPEFQARLRPVLTWKSRVTLLRDVPPGRSVSYGRTFVTPGPMRIATVGLGYADGFPRHLSNAGAEVLIGGRRCAVLGRVTMDQILVDATGTNAATGDEVVLIGRQGTEEILASELAQKAGTIAWEIFTGIGTRVVRCPV